MLRKTTVFIVAMFVGFMLLLALVMVLRDHQGVKRMESTLVTAEDICRKDRKAPLTPYQRRMCEYLAYEFKDDPIMVEIAFCESSWHHQERDGKVRVNYNNDKHQSIDVGLFGINLHWNGGELERLGFDPYDVRGNVKAAKHLREKRGYQDWTSSKGCWGWVLAQQA